MKLLIGVIALAFAGCVNAPHARKEARNAASPVARAKPAATSSAPATHDLAALAAMTFDCPKAALDAAAREAAKIPSQGSYQFAFFRIVSDAHHAAYEIHFRSNHRAEPDLRYCAAIYCQQGWDPRKTQLDLKLMSDSSERRGGKHEGCAAHASHVKTR